MKKQRKANDMNKYMKKDAKFHVLLIIFEQLL